MGPDTTAPAEDECQDCGLVVIAPDGITIVADHVTDRVNGLPRCLHCQVHA